MMKIKFSLKLVCILAVHLFFFFSNAQQNTPPKSKWTITSSSNQEERFNGTKAADNDFETRWSSAWSDEQWLKIDAGATFECSGMRIYWDEAYGRSFTIYSSIDNKNWNRVYETTSGTGDVQDIFMATHKARYFKLDLKMRGSGWGYSIYELDLKGKNEAPIIKENGEIIKNGISLLDGNEETIWKSKQEKETELVINLQKPADIGGIHLIWDKAYAQDLTYYTSLDEKEWQEAVKITEGLGQFEILKHKKRTVQFIKLALSNPKNSKGFAIKDMSLYGPNKEISKLTKYEILAQKMPLGLYPTQLRDMQVYWTLLGVPNDTEESLFDEYGNTEPVTKAPMLMPILKVNGKLLTAFDAKEIKQELADGYLPVPTVKWIFEDFVFNIEATAHGKPRHSISEVSYTFENKTSQPIDAKLFFVINPIQTNPKWQHGGLSEINKFNIQNEKGNTKVVINDNTLFKFDKQANRSGVVKFSDGPIMQHLYKNKFPTNNKNLKSEEGLISGALEYALTTAANKSNSVRVAIPLHKNEKEINFNTSFSKVKASEVKYWKEKLDKVGFSLGNKEVEQTLKAQIGYILLNQDGVVIQPGSRNYNRTWIRDGAMTCSALLRMGLFEEAKEYLEWYALRVRDNGHVPPILMNNGDNYHGFGADIEWDAQGEFIYGLMEYYRFTKDKTFLKKHFNTIEKAMEYMVELRGQTLKEGYMADKKGSERFKGIMPPSISHEGYGIPTHSNWDNFWALRGWIDGSYAAKEMGQDQISEWALKEHKKLATSLKQSLKLTSEFFDIDYVPSSADLGDPDPTSIAIGLFPCESLSFLPDTLVKNTFESYIKSVKERVSNGQTYAYTPYENRNILALAKLGMRKEASELHDIIFKDRRPTGWKHWTELIHSRERLGGYIGDMPHTWVGSGYMNSVRGLVIMENDLKRRIELLNGVPLNWLEGEGVKLTDLPTHFGNTNMKMLYKNKQLTVNIDGKFNDLKKIKLFWPTNSKPKSVLVDGVKAENYTKNSIILTPYVKKIEAFW